METYGGHSARDDAVLTPDMKTGLSEVCDLGALGDWEILKY